MAEDISPELLESRRQVARDRWALEDLRRSPRRPPPRAADSSDGGWSASPDPADRGSDGILPFIWGMLIGRNI